MRKPYSKKNPPPMWADRSIRLEFEEGWNHVKDGWFLKMPPKGNQKNLGMWATYLTHQCQNGDYRACSAIQTHEGKKKFGIYAYCSNCKSKLPEQIKSLMRFAIQ